MHSGLISWWKLAKCQWNSVFSQIWVADHSIRRCPPCKIVVASPQESTPSPTFLLGMLYGSFVCFCLAVASDKILLKQQCSLFMQHQDCYFFLLCRFLASIVFSSSFMFFFSPKSYHYFFRTCSFLVPLLSSVFHVKRTKCLKQRFLWYMTYSISSPGK